jgi:hypothetical protein
MSATCGSFEKPCFVNLSLRPMIGGYLCQRARRAAPESTSEGRFALKFVPVESKLQVSYKNTGAKIGVGSGLNPVIPISFRCDYAISSLGVTKQVYSYWLASIRHYARADTRLDCKRQ